MTSALEKRKIYTPYGDVSLEALGIPEDLADRYIEFRNKIGKAEDFAQTEAVKELKKTKIWTMITHFFRNADEVLNDKVNFHFMFLPQAQQLIEEMFPVIQGQSYDEWGEKFKDNLALGLASWIYHETRLAYGRSLGFHTDFHQSIQELGKITDDLYWSAQDSCYFKKQS